MKPSNRNVAQGVPYETLFLCLDSTHIPNKFKVRLVV